MAAAVIFLLVGFRPPVRIERGQQAQYGLTLALLALLAVSIVLIFVSIVTSRSENTSATITTMIDSAFPPETAVVLDIQITRDGRLMIADFVVHDFSGSLGANDINALQSDISNEVDRDVILRASIVNSSLVISDDQERAPTVSPTIELTPGPTVTVGVAPSDSPTATPTGTATFTPTPVATRTVTPTLTMTLDPTEIPITEPAETPLPTLQPSLTSEPTIQPTGTSPIDPTPTEEPTEESVSTPTETIIPTIELTIEPSS